MNRTSSSWLTPAGLLLGLLPGLLGGAEPKLADRLDYTTPAGVTCTVTADGLSRISLGQRQLAAGGWYAWNAGPSWFGLASSHPASLSGYSADVYKKAAAALTEKILEVVNPQTARVRQVQSGLVTSWTYEFAGEDVTISARIENTHPAAAIAIPAMGGLRFSFAQEPEGLLIVWHTSYLTSIKLSAFNPSHQNKIAGSYAQDGTVGVGLSPLKTGLARTLLFWDYDRWNPDTPERRANRWLTYLRADPILPGGALTFHMTMRVSPDVTRPHLLEPYQAHFLTTYGPLQYHPDYRPVTVAHVNRNREDISPANPYGFHGGFRRLDQEKAVNELCDLLIPALQQANGQGLIIWGQGGSDPRGAMYRPDFDILPPEVEKNFPLLVKRFKDAGLRVGVCTRPGEIAYRHDWQEDWTLRLNPDDPAHLEMMWARFKNLIDKGCTLFYLDTFGNSYDDVKIMRWLRQKMGPEIQTFVEHQCDAIVPYSGIYTETDFWAAGSAEWAKTDQYAPRMGLQAWEIYRWLCPEVNAISRQYDVHGKIPAGFESAEHFFFRHRISPMTEDYLLPKMAPELKRLQEQFH